MVSIIPNLKKARKNAGFKTQQQFADKLGVSIDTVRKWEQGKNTPGIDMLIRIADICGCDTDYLLGRIEEKTHDIEFIVNYTGLSNDSIKCLHLCNKYEIDLLNNIITRNSVFAKDGRKAIRFIAFYSMLIRDEQAETPNTNRELQITGMQAKIRHEIECFLQEIMWRKEA